MNFYKKLPIEVTGACPQPKRDQELKVSVETRNSGDVLIVHCQGRLVYRDGPSELVRVVADMFRHTSRVVIDLSGVTTVEGAGLGELALLQSEASAYQASLRFTAPNTLLRYLLALTNLDSVLDIRDTIAEAVESFQEEDLCAQC